MRICGTFDGQDFSEDVNWLDLEETTSADLFSLVKQKAALRANVALVEVLCLHSPTSSQLEVMCFDVF